MSNYNAPNPYVEGVPFKGNTPGSNSNSVCGVVGITPNGDTTKPVLVTSWPEFIEKFAIGVDTPFMTNSYLSYAVFGFFQNGGSVLNVQRIVGAGAKKATDGVYFEAKNEGEWGNKISVVVTKSEKDEAGYDEGTVVVKYRNVIVESFEVSTNPDATNFMHYVIDNNSAYIKCLGEGNVPDEADTTITLTNGADDLTSIGDDNYTDVLKNFDKVYNLAALAIPGQTSVSVVKGLLDYTKDKPILPVLDFPATYTTADEYISFAKTNAKGKQTAGYIPNVKVVDPLSVTGNTKEIPPSGHLLGLIARTIDTKGEWNAPAGTEALLKGVVGVAREFTDEERGKLNNANVNVIVAKPNYGIIVWGARAMSDDAKLRYVSNLTLDYTLRRNFKDAMQQFMFRQNGPSLWVDIKAEITGILETKRLAGAFAGATPAESYYVICDSSLNTQAVMDKGQVICEVGYAANNPAEFIIVRVAHQIS